MSYIVVYFTNVVDRRRVWRRVSKICKRWKTRVDFVIELRNCTRTDLTEIYGRIAMHERGVVF